MRLNGMGKRMTARAMKLSLRELRRVEWTAINSPGICQKLLPLAKGRDSFAREIIQANDWTERMRAASVREVEAREEAYMHLARGHWTLEGHFSPLQRLLGG